MRNGLSDKRGAEIGELLDRTLGPDTDSGKGRALDEGIMVNRRKQLIAVIGVGRGAGATFVSMRLALELADMGKSTSYVESRFGGYDILTMDRHFPKKEFVDLFDRQSRGLPVDNRINLYKGVNWVVMKEPSVIDDKKYPVETDRGMNPGKYPGMNRGINHETDHGTDHGMDSGINHGMDHGKHLGFDPLKPAGEYVIWDTDRESVEKLDRKPDALIIVFEMLPSRILTNLDTFRWLKENESDFRANCLKIYFANKVNRGADLRELERFLRVKADFIQEDMGYERACRAEFSGQSFFTAEPCPEIRKMAEELMEELF